MNVFLQFDFTLMNRKYSAVPGDKRTILCFIFFLSLSLFCLGQDSVIVVQPAPKNLVSINIGGETPGVGLTYQRNLLNRVGVEGGIGFAIFDTGGSRISFGTQVKCYLRRIQLDQVNAYLGGAYIRHISENCYYPSLGFCKIFKNGFTFSCEIGELLIRADYTYYDETINWYMRPYGRLGMGFQF